MRGFPARDIFSLRALRDGLGQGARVVGAPSSASFLQVLVCVGKNIENRDVVKKIKEWWSLSEEKEEICVHL